MPNNGPKGILDLYSNTKILTKYKLSLNHTDNRGPYNTICDHVLSWNYLLPQGIEKGSQQYPGPILLILIVALPKLLECLSSLEKVISWCLELRFLTLCFLL